MAFDDYKPAWEVKELDASERLVLLNLAEHRNGNKDSENFNLCCPGYTTIIRETGLSRSSVSDAIKGLRVKVPLTIVVDPRKRKSNRYLFPWNEAVNECSPDEQGVRLTNRVFANRTECSPNERGVRQADYNKELNNEVNLETNQEHNSPAEQGSAVVRGSNPNTDDREALRIACLFREVLGKAGNLQPEKAPNKWVKPFSELLPE